MMSDDNSKNEIIKKAQTLFDEGYACSQSVLLAFADKFKLDEHTAKMISSTFGGGMGRLRQTCGAVTGSFMVLGLAYGNNNPLDLETKLAAYKKVRELNQQFIQLHGTSNCAQLLKNHATEKEVVDRKHHKIICRQLVGDATALVYSMLEN